MNCIFCQIIANSAPHHRVWENENFVAFLDINPLKRGHLLILPRQHIDYVFDLPEDLYLKMFQAARQIAAPLRKAIGAKRIGLVLEGFTVPHCHLHLIPIDHENELDPCKAAPVNDSELSKAAEIIISNINDELKKKF